MTLVKRYTLSSKQKEEVKCLIEEYVKKITI